MKVMSKNGHPKILRRPLQHIYPLEVRHEPTTDAEPGQDMTPDEPDQPSSTSVETVESSTSGTMSRRPTRSAAAQARDRILGCAIEASCD